MSMQKTDDGLGWISTSDPTRETLGTQIIRAENDYANAPSTQEVGETMSELGKTICKGLEEAINNARSKGIQGRIYIYIVETPMPIKKPVMQLTFYTRRTRPTPEWNTCLYSHDDHDSAPKLCWALPEYAHHRAMLRDKHKHSPDHIRWIQQMLNGLLV